MCEQGRGAARTEVERPRREDLGADGVGVARVASLWDWGRVWGACSPEKKSILDLKMAILGAFWTLFCAVQLFV